MVGLHMESRLAVTGLKLQGQGQATVPRPQGKSLPQRGIHSVFRVRCLTTFVAQRRPLTYGCLSLAHLRESL